MRTRVLIGLVGLLLVAGPAPAQNAVLPLNRPGAGPGGFLPPGGGQQLNGQQSQGGGANADFEGLMDLIISTVAPESWAETGGGEAEIRPFIGGVYADAQGTLRRGHSKLDAQQREALGRDLDRLRDAAAKRPAALSGGKDPRAESALRCVSLVRLERELTRRMEAGEPLEEAMLTLAGLRRVEYVFAYPESGDLAIAGPAGDWRVTPERRIVAAETGQPVVRLDDLITLMRRGGVDSPFGCSINPRQQSLAKAQRYLTKTGAAPLRPGTRGRWLEEVRTRVGLQDLSYFGVAPDSRVACVLADADYHMKLIGMGLEEGVPGMESYLESIRVTPGEAPPAVGVVRWWFAMSYAGVAASPGRDAFALLGQGAKVLSENELLAERGERIPTGQSDELTQAFANSFTENFEQLTHKYPVYAELRNVFDLALALALIKSEGLDETARWKPALLVDAERLPLPEYEAPTTVDTVANLRVVRRRHIVAGVSGGVWVQTASVLKDGVRESTEYGPLTHHERHPPAHAGGWWWDVR